MSILGDFQRLTRTLFCATSWKDEQIKLLSDSLAIYDIDGRYAIKEVIALDSITEVTVVSETLFDVQYSFQGKSKTITWRCKDSKPPVKLIKRAIGDEVSVDLPVVTPLAASKFSKTIKLSQADIQPSVKKEVSWIDIPPNVKKELSSINVLPNIEEKPVVAQPSRSKEWRVKNPTKMFIALACALQLRQRAAIEVMQILVDETRSRRVHVLQKYIALRHRSVCEKTINLVLTRYQEEEKRKETAAMAIARFMGHRVRLQSLVMLQRWKFVDSSFEVTENLWKLNEKNFDLIDEQVLLKGIRCIKKLSDRSIFIGLRALSGARPIQLDAMHVEIVEERDLVEAINVQVAVPSQREDEAHETHSLASSAASSRKGSIASSVRNLFSLKSNK